MRTLIALALVISTVPLRAQLFVDYGGPRNIFQVAGDQTPTSAKLLKFDTAEKSISYNLFGQKHDSFVFGGSGKVAALDGLEDFLKFDKTPKLEGQILANWTNYPSNYDSKGDPTRIVDPAKPYPTGPNKTLFSFTGRAVASQAEFYLYDVATSTAKKKTFSATEAYLTGAYKFPTIAGKDTYSIAITLGAKNDSNYETLPEVDVGAPVVSGGMTAVSNAKKARAGKLEEFSSYPVHLMYVYETEVKWAWINSLPKMSSGQKFLITTPYAIFTPRTRGDTAKSYGLNFTLKEFIAGDSPSKDKFVFPYSFFVERRKSFDAKDYITKAGISVVFSL